MRLLLVLGAFLLLTAAPVGAQTPPEDPDPTITDGTAQARLDAARARWKEQGLRDYSFDASLSCFCPPEYTSAATIVVRRGHPRGAVPARYRGVATVARQFKRIQAAIDRGVAGLTVRYARRGRPTAVFIDESRMIADEETGYRFRRFLPIRGT